MRLVTRLVRTAAAAALFLFAFSPAQAAENSPLEHSKNPSRNTFLPSLAAS